MLLQKYQPEEVDLASREGWHPYPKSEERRQWEALPESVRKAYVTEGERTLNQHWPILLASRYLDFARTGNRTNYEKDYFGRRAMLSSLVIAECVEHLGRFLDEIVNGIWLICEESSWCVPAHIDTQKSGVGLPDNAEPMVDLFAAETAALIAWTSYLLSSDLNAVSPLVLPRMRREAETRVLRPCMERNDFWWMGFGSREVNNWNPYVNSNWLATLLLIETDEDRRLGGVMKIMRSLDRFIDHYPSDGGCDEGPGYWDCAAGTLFDCLELLLSATNGQINVYNQPLIKDIGRYIYRVQIDGLYFVNFADASVVNVPPPYVVFKYGQRIGDVHMSGLGAWLAVQQDLLHRSMNADLGRILPALFDLANLFSTEPRLPLPRDIWLDQIQIMVARDREGSSQGFFVAAKGGHNAESHNHNDVGNAIVYVDGKPVIVDAGVGTYSRKTFSQERYEIWTMQSGYHNLPTIGGVMQTHGKEFAAKDVSYTSDAESAQLTVDIAKAYPAEAKVNSWRRNITLRRGRYVQVTDAYDMVEPPQEITLNLLTPCEVNLETPGRISLAQVPLPSGRCSGAALLDYNADKLTVTVERMSMSDMELRESWGDHLTRLVLHAEKPLRQDSWTIRIRSY